MRKTVSIKTLVDQVNDFNASSSDDMKDAREAKNMFLEQILMDAKAYRGFSYLFAHQLEGDATTVGIREGETSEKRFKDTDHTRVYYNVAEGL